MSDGAEVPLRELNQQRPRVLARVAAGETVTIAKDGVPIGDTVPCGTATGRAAYSFRTDPMGDLDIPDLGGPVLDDEIAFTPKDPRHLAHERNVALAAAFRTVDRFTTDSRFRMMRPLTAGEPAFRLLPDDL
ncbi:hypothetical protein [Streptomyces sp. CoT10]|uniref:hypothetical protein n=1 Tax=Streptomyces sp. CoT10 TaxID=2875762 RepID=UPI001CD67576|nr:hypothetical protein [Streptomyces sp. CoT10]